jgi:ABC-type polysaccharide/polyol phosphate transport system ATPase subunit
MERALAIRIEHVSKVYQTKHLTVRDIGRRLLARFRNGASPAIDGQVFALHDVSIDVRAGERVGLIGRNGSGKSTLLKLIAGVLQPTLGFVRVEGNVQSILELGVGFNPDFTGRENILLHGSLLGLPRRAILDGFPEIVAFAEIGEFMDRPLKYYSSGMVLRVAFAVFVLVHPEILIIDEAIAVGDIFFQQRCYDFLRGPLANATQIIVSHDPAQLAALCSRLIILEGGKLDYDGPIAPGIERYLKSLHNEGAGSATPVLANPVNPPAEIVWTTLQEHQLSGRGAVRIIQAAVTDAANQPVRSRAPGERVVVHIIVRVHEPRENLIFGYLIRDGTGQQVCGQNSWLLRDAEGRRTKFLLSETGDWHAVLEFDWPALKPQTYTLTLGIGEGVDAHLHTVQCWAHDCFQILGQDPDNMIHGLFGSGLVALRHYRLTQPGPPERPRSARTGSIE